MPAAKTASAAAAAVIFSPRRRSSPPPLVSSHAREPSRCASSMPTLASLGMPSPRSRMGASFAATRSASGAGLLRRRCGVASRGFEQLRNHPSFDPNASPPTSPSPSAPSAAPHGPADGAIEPGPQPVRVQSSRGGRGGKTVSVVSGLPSSQLRNVCKELKRRCGAGGAVKGDTVEIQGNHSADIVEVLKAMGFSNTKKSGG